MIEALQNLNVLGLIYDGVGVTVLGIPSLLESAKNTHRESATYWDGNKPLMQRLIRAKFDTSAGSILLIVGFVLQLLATLKVQGSLWAAVPLWVFVVALPTAYFASWRSKLVARFATSVAAMGQKSQP